MASKYNIKVQYAAWMATMTLATVVVMTAVHLWRELDEQQKMARHRGEITAQTLARSVASAVANDDISAIGRAGELIEQVKSKARMKEIPVVILTTFDREEDVSRWYKFGTKLPPKNITVS